MAQLRAFLFFTVCAALLAASMASAANRKDLARAKDTSKIGGCIRCDLSGADLENGFFQLAVLIEANLSGEIPHIIKSVPSVISFLGEMKGGNPVPLRMSEVNRMLGKVDELSIKMDNNNSIPFIINETIKVIDGPFNGFNGTVEKINEEKRKLEVMVKIFGRKTPLELSFMQVEKV